MILVSNNSNNRGGVRDLVVHLVPAIVAILLFQVIAIQVYYYNPLSYSKVNFFVWCISQAVGSFVLGYISDHYCRKKVFIVTQIFGFLSLLLLLWTGYKELFSILFLGLTFSPSPIVRAALIDNFPRESKVKLIGLSFIAVFLPWCFFNKLIKMDPDFVLLVTIIFLAINLLFTIFVFQDRRDLSNSYQKKPFFIRKNRKKVLLTTLALLSGQIVFFLSDSYFEESAQNAPFFTALGIGVLLGSIISVFYRNIPHISLLTVCYGIGLIFSLLSVLTASILSSPDGSLATQIMLFSILGGFYLPFVFDVILSSVSSNYRGVACGILEVIISISALLGLGMVILFNPNEREILFLMTLLFLMSTILQKRSENDLYMHK